MLSDGMIGNKALLLALSSLTTGNLNSKMQKTAKPFRMQYVLPSTHDYIVPPLSDEQQREQTNKQLMAFVAMKPGSEAFLKV
jgi:hypothetical protein